MPKKKTEGKSNLSSEEFEKKVLELAEKGLTSEKIGQTLKNQGIHSSKYSKKISKILKGKGKYLSADIENIEKKFNKLETHLSKNKQDKRATRERSRIFSKLRRAKKYYK